MRPGLLDMSPASEALASEFLAFVVAQGTESAAKLISFFHLVDPERMASIDFEIKADGCVQLRIVAIGERDEEDLPVPDP